ncbi:30S ribosomal protein S6 alpha, chloroplastic-like [Mangifera indica]|uniref:30S ribosomal protein S6 alpha, chloroplastic-like n=1 Tax=Mangifera indica TaxID=29780 RepID=UPI001CFB208F|nr:30S ribosomal protein S6 alpha, chloroplastic-like [Mangifera indica]
MATPSLTLPSTLSPYSKSSFYPHCFSQFPSPPLLSFTRTLKPFRTRPKSVILFPRSNSVSQALGFSGSFFEGGGFGSDEDPTSVPRGSVGTATAIKEKEEPQCPPGLRQYETMMVLRPDMSEDERIALTQKYEELLVAGGGMYVEVFNRGMIPLAYSIKKRNKAGESNTYLDGIYLLFTYYTKPESMQALEVTMNTDDNVRASSFKVRKHKR